MNGSDGSLIARSASGSARLSDVPERRDTDADGTRCLGGDAELPATADGNLHGPDFLGAGLAVAAVSRGR